MVVARVGVTQVWLMRFLQEFSQGRADVVERPVTMTVARRSPIR